MITAHLYGHSSGKKIQIRAIFNIIPGNSDISEESFLIINLGYGKLRVDYRLTPATKYVYAVYLSYSARINK